MSPFRLDAKGATVRIRVSPKASGTRMMGVCEEADGGRSLRIAVAAAPEGGKANAALLRFLARQWGLPKARLSIAAGAAGRCKTIRIAGNAADVRAVLAPWAARFGFSLGE